MGIVQIDKSKIDFNNVYKNAQDAQSGSNSYAVSEKYQEYWGDNGSELFFDEETGAVYEAAPGSSDMKGATKMGYIKLVDTDANKPIKTLENTTTNKQSTKEDLDDPSYYADEIAANKNTKKVETKSTSTTASSNTTPSVSSTASNTVATTTKPSIKSISIDNGEATTIPIKDDRGQYYTVTEYDKFFSKWNKGTGQRAVADIWNSQGQSFDHGIATIDVNGEKKISNRNNYNIRKIWRFNRC
ncbi:MAG: hypothetical protein IJ565_01415 [Bacilli bacterium]|nr:hypothetical protein [Bacilli bacterium]